MPLLMTRFGSAIVMTTSWSTLVTKITGAQISYRAQQSRTVSIKTRTKILGARGCPTTTLALRRPTSVPTYSMRFVIPIQVKKSGRAAHAFGHSTKRPIAGTRRKSLFTGAETGQIALPVSKNSARSFVPRAAYASTVWLHEEVGHNQDANREQQALNPQNPFKTPKPEALLFRILSLASDQGDIVLDSFAGSGTTGAVAHKMGRRWIMIELGEHCHSHIIPRLRRVINNEDDGGATKITGFKGGGGFRYSVSRLRC